MPNLTSWIITDFKIGDKNLCRGIAQKLSFPYKEIEVSPPFPWSLMMPYVPFIPPWHKPSCTQSPITKPFPDFVIASSRVAFNYITTIKKQAPHVTTIFLKNPYVKNKYIDLIWRPEHDFISTPAPKGTFTTLTAPNQLSPETLKTNKKNPWRNLPSPFFGCLIGDPFRFFPSPQEAMQSFIAQFDVFSLSTSGTFIITTSRRTPPEFTSFLQHYLQDKKLSYLIIPPSDYNPYLDILTFCDAFIVSGDSHNMISEALITGKPLHIIQSPYEKEKLRYFTKRLFEIGVAKPLASPFTSYKYQPIDATLEICQRLLERHNINKRNKGADI